MLKLLWLTCEDKGLYMVRKCPMWQGRHSGGDMDLSLLAFYTGQVASLRLRLIICKRTECDATAKYPDFSRSWQVLLVLATRFTCVAETRFTLSLLIPELQSRPSLNFSHSRGSRILDQEIFVLVVQALHCLLASPFLPGEDNDPLISSMPLELNETWKCFVA